MNARKFGKLSLVLALSLGLGLILTGCGDNGGGADCSSDTDCSGTTPKCKTGTGKCVECLAQADCGAGQDCSPDTNTCVAVGTFRAKLINFASGRNEDVPVPGVMVRALDNDTGDELGMEVESGGDGWLEFQGLPAGKVGFLAESVVGEKVKTYQFQIDSSAQDERLWSVDLGTYQMAPALAGITIDPTKGIAAGAVYYVDQTDCELPVGCGTIKPDPQVGDIRYFGDNDLPTKLAADDPNFGRDDINPLNGYWIVGNMDPGEVKVEAFLDTKMIGDTRFVVFPDSVAIGNIYSDNDPQPATCTPDPEPQGCE